ncbi:hypothetical protein Tco_1196659, partial [Tanacetum coccineum]
ETILRKGITMETPDLNGTHTTPLLSNLNPAEPKTNNNVKIEMSNELLMKLRNNAYNKAEANNAVDHITRFLHILDLVKTPNVDPKQLRIIAFPLSLTGGACRWWMKEGNDKITTWFELVDKYYPLSHASRMNDTNEDRECHQRFMNWLSSKFKNPWKLNSATKNALWNFWDKGYDNDTLINDEESSNDESDELDHVNHHDTNPFFDPYLNDKDKGNKSYHMECNDNTSGLENFILKDAPHSENIEQPNEGICIVDKFEVIKYSIGDHEEFLAIHTHERDS